MCNGRYANEEPRSLFKPSRPAHGSICNEHNRNIIVDNSTEGLPDSDCHSDCARASGSDHWLWSTEPAT